MNGTGETTTSQFSQQALAVRFLERTQLEISQMRACLPDDLIALEPPAVAQIERMAHKVVGKALSVRATEEAVRRERGDGPTVEKPKPVEKTAIVKDLEQKLTRALGARVAVHDKGGGKGGRIEIEYGNLDDLDRLLDKLLEHARN